MTTATRPDISIANVIDLPSTLQYNTRDIDVSTDTTTIEVRLSELYRNTAKVMLRLGRRETIQHLRATDDALIHDAERPATYDATIKAIATADGPNVTFTALQVECLWAALAAVTFENLLERDGKVHYIESTLLRATNALESDALGRLPADCRP